MPKNNKKRSAGVFVLRSMIIMAMLTAMAVALDRVPGLSIKTPGWKIGFSFIPPMIAAMLLGPVQSAIVYGLADFIGAILFPFGPYHPGFTVCAALMGFIMGLFLNKRPLAVFGSEREWRSIGFFPNMIVPVIINCALIGLVVNTYWVSRLYGSKTYGGWFSYRLVEYAILIPVQLLLIPALLRLCTLLKKAGLGGTGRSYGPSQKRLSEISRNESILGLERVNELLERLDSPQNNVKVVHVAGTNGKGSFTAMLASVLKAAGYKVGSFTSPALTGVTDSFRIDCEQVAEEVFDERLSEIEPYIKEMTEKPTEFEVMTAAAFEIFAQENCDIAIVECGLGGDLDATNTVKEPMLSVITNVQLDHCGLLGNTTKEIAAHKAGIIKKGCPVLFGGLDEAAAEVISEKAASLNAPLFRTAQNSVKVLKTDLNGVSFTYGDRGPYTLSLVGAYQPQNAANVLAAVDILNTRGLSISEEAVKKGLASVSWHARFEVISQEPTVIFDGAHNPEGVGLAAQSIAGCFPGKKAVLLMSVMKDKAYSEYPALLASVAEKVFTAAPQVTARALDPKELAACFRDGGIDAEAFEDMDGAIEAALRFAASRGLPLVAMGTLYMYGEFTERFNSLFKNFVSKGVEI